MTVTTEVEEDAQPIGEHVGVASLRDRLRVCGDIGNEVRENEADNDDEASPAMNAGRYDTGGAIGASATSRMGTPAVGGYSSLWTPIAKRRVHRSSVGPVTNASDGSRRSRGRWAQPSGVAPSSWSDRPADAFRYLGLPGTGRAWERSISASKSRSATSIIVYRYARAYSPRSGCRDLGVDDDRLP